MSRQLWALARMAVLAVLLLGIVVMHHVDHPDRGRAHPESTAASAHDPVVPGYQDSSGHFGAVGPAGSVLRDHEAGHHALYICLGVLILLLGWRPPPSPTSRRVSIDPGWRASPPRSGRPLPRDWGISLLLSLCVMRT